MSSFTGGQLVKKHTDQSPGVTLLELLIAISVTMIVITLAFGVFTDIFKGFWFQKNHAKQVREMVVAKQWIESGLKNITRIDQSTDKSISFYRSNSDSLMTMQFSGDSVCLGKQKLCRGFSEFSFELIRKNDSPNRRMLFWHGILKQDGWIGGAIEIEQ
jgi:hypothetical protein